jgi:hypothetical protein
VFRDHAQFGDGKAVISSAGTHCPGGFMSREFHVMAEMCLEIDTAGGDLEKLTSAVLHNCIVAIRSAQATFNVGRVRVAAGVGSLRKSQSHQHRYNHH